MERFKAIPNLTKEAREKVTYGNAAKLLKLTTETEEPWPKRAFD